jgi:dipeptidyl aminopeptidase/acylaminoacyl peptidase
MMSFAIVSAGCEEKERPPVVTKPVTETIAPASVGLELQKEDYAVARTKFRTRLIRLMSSPQRFEDDPPFGNITEAKFESDKVELKAWVNLPAPGMTDCPAVLYLHSGWAFGAGDWDDAESLRKAGYVVMMPVLRGENGQSGMFSMFYNELDDVLAAADYLSELKGMDPKRIYVAGHAEGGTLALMAAMASKKFRAAASISAPLDIVEFSHVGLLGFPPPFDVQNIREFQMRSPVAYATSFKCPVRLYRAIQDDRLQGETNRTATLAKNAGLDVEAVNVPGDRETSVKQALPKAIKFFHEHGGP